MTRIESAAWNGELMPKDADVFEEIEYLALVEMCKLYKAGSVSADIMKDYRTHLDNEIKSLKEKYAFHIRLLENAADTYKKTELAKSTYRTNRTIENADKLVAVLDGLEAVE